MVFYLYMKKEQNSQLMSTHHILHTCKHYFFTVIQRAICVTCRWIRGTEINRIALYRRGTTWLCKGLSPDCDPDCVLLTFAVKLSAYRKIGKFLQSSLMWCDTAKVKLFVTITSCLDQHQWLVSLWGGLYNLFIFSWNKYLWSNYYVPGTVACTEDNIGAKPNLCSTRVYI